MRKAAISADDFVVLQRKLGWSNLRLAEELGVHKQQVCRWRTGHSPVPGPVAFAMDALVDGWRRKGETK